jgi:hypothetical protein
VSAVPIDRRGNAHLEEATEEFLRKRIRLVGGYAFKWVPTIAGVPDRMVLMPGGRTYFVELKQLGKKPTPIQEVWHSRLRALGYQVVVLDSKAAVLDWICQIVDASGPAKGKPGPRPR